MKKICKAFAAALIAVLSFVSCNNNYSLDSQNEETENAYLSFAINEDLERKIAPVELAWNEVDSIELTKNNAALKTWKASATKSAYDQMKADDSISLDAGKYNFAITLKDKAGDILQTGKLNDFEIKGGKNLLNFETKAWLEGKGKLTINCSYKDYQNRIYKVDYLITPVKGGEEISDEACAEDDSEEIFTLTFDDMDCGEYIVTLKLWFEDDLEFYSNGRYLGKTELVEIQNKRETVFNCVASEETQYAPIDYLFPNGDSVEFTEEVSLYNLGASLPSVDIIKNKPEGANFLGWFDNDDNKLTKLPETSTEKVSIIAKFEKTATTTEDISDERVIYNVIPTDNTWESIYSYINGTGIVCSRLDLSNITTDISEYKFGDIKVQEVILPNSLTSLCDGAFSKNSTLTRIIIPEDSLLTSIGNSAFEYCTSLKEITIPASVTKIVNGAFYYCTSLKEISIPAIVTELGDNTFQHCESLEKVIFAENTQLTSIGASAFYYCTSLKEITIPAGVTEIASSTFSNCENLEAVSFGENSKLTSIGNFGFNECSSLKNITIPAGITEIGEYAFSCCSKLEKVTFAENTPLTNIGAYAFENCTSLKEFTIPTNVTKIEDSAFEYCTSLKEITIPASVIQLGDNVFQGCEGLFITIPFMTAKIYFKSELQEYTYSFKAIVDDEDKKGIAEQEFKDWISLKEVVISENITFIEDKAFEGCSGLTKVTFTGTSKLESIGKSAFLSCTALKEITIPASVTTIEDSAFDWCSGIEKITVEEGNTKYDSRNNCNAIIEKDTNTLIFGCKNTVIPDNVEKIGTYAFEFSRFTEITIPASVTEIGERAFFECSKLKKVIFETGSKLTSISKDTFEECYDIKEITIPYNIKNLFKEDYLSSGDYSFKVIIEDGTESIETEAFKDWISLKEVVIPEGVKSIGYRTFEQTALEKVTIPASVKTLDSSAFYFCPYLKTVKFEEGSELTSIGDSAFSYCSSLEEINIPETVTTIGESAFNSCGSLEKIYIPSGVTEIKKATFFSCAALEDVEFDFFTSKPKLETIGDNAFESCSSLTAITLPDSLTSIGYNAFANCTSLELCDYEKEKVTVDETAFINCPRLRE